METEYLKELRYIEKKTQEIKEKTKKLTRIKSFDPEHYELLLKIKRELPDFNEKELLEFIRNVIPNIHYFISNERLEKVKRYCDKKLIEKINKEKDKYRITPDIDNMRVEYARIEKCLNDKDNFYIQIYSSIFFYDEVANNIEKNDYIDQYWNDIWLITVKENSKIGHVNKTKCPNCGAAMEYSGNDRTFNCNYCRNKLYITQLNWKVIDIELLK